MQACSYLPSLPLVYQSVHNVCIKSVLWQYLVECDEVVLMKDGQIAEHGTHAQLMAQGRDYATLFSSVQQEVGYSSPPPRLGKTPGSLAHGVLHVAFCTIHEVWPARLLFNKC